MDFDDALLQALSECETPEEMTAVIRAFSKKGGVTLTRIITIHYTCNLCKQNWKKKEEVLATANVVSTSLKVNWCGYCKEELLKLPKRCLVDMLIASISFGNPFAALAPKQLYKHEEGEEDDN